MSMEHIFKTQDIQQLLTGQFEKHFLKNNRMIKSMHVVLVLLLLLLLAGQQTVVQLFNVIFSWLCMTFRMEGSTSTYKNKIILI